MSELTELKAEVARLKAKMDRVAPDPEPEEPRPDWVPLAAFKDNCGVWRDGGGNVLVRPDALTSEERLAQQKQEREEWAKETQRFRAHDGDGNPLPKDFFRDPHGLIRSSDGRLAQVVEREEKGGAEINRLIGEQHHEDLKVTRESWAKERAQTQARNEA